MSTYSAYTRHASLGQSAASQPAQPPLCSQEKSEELVNERIKAMVNKHVESLLAWEHKMEAFVEEKLVQMSSKMSESVMKLEDRLDGLADIFPVKADGTSEGPTSDATLAAQSGEVLTSRSLQTQSTCPASGRDWLASVTLEDVLQLRGISAGLESRLSKLEDCISTLATHHHQSLETRLSKLEDCFSTLAQPAVEMMGQELHQRISDAELLVKSQQQQQTEEISRVERMCAQLEAAHVEAHDSASHNQLHLLQLRGQFMTLEARVEDLHLRAKKAPPIETDSGRTRVKPPEVGEAKVEKVQIEKVQLDEGEALRALEAEVQNVRADYKKMGSLMETVMSPCPSSRSLTEAHFSPLSTARSPLLSSRATLSPKTNGGSSLIAPSAPIAATAEAATGMMRMASLPQFPAISTGTHEATPPLAQTARTGESLQRIGSSPLILTARAASTDSTSRDQGRVSYPSRMQLAERGSAARMYVPQGQVVATAAQPVSITSPISSPPIRPAPQGYRMKVVAASPARRSTGSKALEPWM